MVSGEILRCSLSWRTVFVEDLAYISTTKRMFLLSRKISAATSGLFRSWKKTMSGSIL